MERMIAMYKYAGACAASTAKPNSDAYRPAMQYDPSTSVTLNLYSVGRQQPAAGVAWRTWQRRCEGPAARLDDHKVQSSCLV